MHLRKAPPPSSVIIVANIRSSSQERKSKSYSEWDRKWSEKRDDGKREDEFPKWISDMKPLILRLRLNPIILLVFSTHQPNSSNMHFPILL